MGVLRVNQNPYDEFISSGSTTKKGQEREGSRERAKRKGKEKGGGEGKEEKRVWAGRRRGGASEFPKVLIPRE